MERASLLNPLPPAVWALVLPLAAFEAWVGFAGLGFGNGLQPAGSGLALRLNLIEQLALPQTLGAAVLSGAAPGFEGELALRLLTYPLAHLSLGEAIFSAVLILAMGQFLARALGGWAFLLLFFATSVLGALFVLVTGWGLPVIVGAEIGTFGLIGAFTHLRRLALAQEGAPQAPAFTLLLALFAVQLLFALLGAGPFLALPGDVAAALIGYFLFPALRPGAWRAWLLRLRAR